MRRTANALAVEPDEVPVISNELLEANVAAIRIDLTDLKADVRAMAAKAESEVKTAIAGIGDQFREVRQDIRELRADNRTLRDKIDENHSSLDKKIDTKLSELCAENKTLRDKIDTTHLSLDRKIDNKFDELSGDMKKMLASIANLNAMQKAILWVLGSVSILAAVVTIAKTLQWI